MKEQERNRAVEFSKYIVVTKRAKDLGFLKKVSLLVKQAGNPPESVEWIQALPVKPVLDTESFTIYQRL
jgi:hypothetical protein